VIDSDLFVPEHVKAIIGQASAEYPDIIQNSLQSLQNLLKSNETNSLTLCIKTPSNIEALIKLLNHKTIAVAKEAAVTLVNLLKSFDFSALVDPKFCMISCLKLLSSKDISLKFLGLELNGMIALNGTY
jgi:hypothetical protein